MAANEDAVLAAVLRLLPDLFVVTVEDAHIWRPTRPIIAKSLVGALSELAYFVKLPNGIIMALGFRWGPQVMCLGRAQSLWCVGTFGLWLGWVTEGPLTANAKNLAQAKQACTAVPSSQVPSNQLAATPDHRLQLCPLLAAGSPSSPTCLCTPSLCFATSARSLPLAPCPSSSSPACKGC